MNFAEWGKIAVLKTGSNAEKGKGMQITFNNFTQRHQLSITTLADNQTQP